MPPGLPEACPQPAAPAGPAALSESGAAKEAAATHQMLSPALDLPLLPLLLALDLVGGPSAWSGVVGCCTAEVAEAVGLASEETGLPSVDMSRSSSSLTCACRPSAEPRENPTTCGPAGGACAPEQRK